MDEPSVPSRQWSIISGSAVPRLLSDRRAVVLERIARGGGATNWFLCADQGMLARIAARLRPGSRVSFYFDECIACLRYGPEVQEKMLRIIAETGDVVAGQLQADGMSLDVEFVGHPGDLSVYTQTLNAGSQIYVGPYPGRDDDGINAVTLTLPDADGVVRSHPY